MKPYLTLILFFLAITFGSTAAFAQDKKESVEAAKVAFLTDKMSLTAEQAQRFWPLYNEFEAKRRELNRSYRSGYRQDVDEMSEQDAKARIDNMFATREKELELEKEYVARYNKVISAKQLILLYRGEREFTKMLLKRLDNGKKQVQ